MRLRRERDGVSTELWGGVQMMLDTVPRQAGVRRSKVLQL